MIRDAAGKLTGLVVGMETWLSDHLPPVTAAEAESRARIMSREMAAAGVTAFTDATTRNGPVEVEQFAKLVQSNAICQRVGVMIGGQHLDAADRCEQIARAAGITSRRRQVHARLSVRHRRPLAPRPPRARARTRLRLPRHRNRRAGRGDRRDRIRQSAILRRARDAALSHRARRHHHARLHRPPDGGQRVGRHQSRLHLLSRSQVRCRARPRRSSVSRAQSARTPTSTWSARPTRR